MLTCRILCVRYLWLFYAKFGEAGEFRSAFVLSYIHISSSGVRSFLNYDSCTRSMHFQSSLHCGAATTTVMQCKKIVEHETMFFRFQCFFLWGFGGFWLLTLSRSRDHYKWFGMARTHVVYTRYNRMTKAVSYMLCSFSPFCFFGLPLQAASIDTENIEFNLFHQQQVERYFLRCIALTRF